MSLKDTINDTNKQKENIKTVANNIDNKLVELGGERATDLFDVPKKIPKMISENYQKVAILRPNKRIDLEYNTTKTETINIDVPFEVGFFCIKIHFYNILFEGDICLTSENNIGYKINTASTSYIKIVGKTSKSITVECSNSHGSYNAHFEVKEIYAIEKKAV